MIQMQQRMMVLVIMLKKNFDCNGICVAEIDCNGVCAGTYNIDECGQCVDNGQCEDFDLDNVCDCIDDCIGEVDDCGICNGPGLNDAGCCGNEVQDCNNVCGGDALLDECGTCDNNIYNDCTQDCLGNWGGGAVFDDCGVCDGNNLDKDCFEICFGNGVIDECDICGGDNSSCNQPIVNNLDIETFEDTPINFFIDASDPNDDELTLILLSNPNHGQIELVENLNIIYTPNNNFSGSDNFIFKVTDGVWESNEAQVYITINEVFDPPTATDISIELLEDESVLIDLSGFDTDSDDNSLEFSIVSNPSNGELVEQRATATYEYTPFSDFYGNDEFIYQVSDGDNFSEATVSINVLNTNDRPTASNFDFSSLQTVDFSNYINDIDGDQLTIRTIPPSPTENLRTVFGNELVYTGVDNIYTYEPSGPFDILLYKAVDEVTASTPALAIYEDFIGAFNRSILKL